MPDRPMPSLPQQLALYLSLIVAWVDPARADHGGPLRSAPMSPLAVALLSGLLALIAGLLIVVIVMLLTRKRASR